MNIRKRLHRSRQRKGILTWSVIGLGALAFSPLLDISARQSALVDDDYSLESNYSPAAGTLETPAQRGMLHQASLTGNTNNIFSNVTVMSVAMAAPALPPAPLPYMTATETTLTVEPELELAPGPSDLVRTIELEEGGTLFPALIDAGVSKNAAIATIQAMKTVHDPRRLRPGHPITANFTISEDGDETFNSLSFQLDIITDVVVTRGEDGEFTASMNKSPVKRNLVQAHGKVRGSLYGAAVDAGLPPKVLMSMVKIFSWDVDFQRAIQVGDEFSVLYEVFETESGDVARYGNVQMAVLDLSGNKHAMYRHEFKDGAAKYFDEKGRGAKKALLRTPVDGARLSSGFGKRKHPILGYRKMHKGVDFAAPAGTPIFAAGDGVIDFIGRRGGYGNYIRIRHNGTFSTAYAHMRAFRKGMKNGTKVKQGQVIGYVGSTGRSTGPHLHYEILKGGTQVDPSGVKVAGGDKLTGKSLAAFKANRKEMETTLAKLIKKSANQQVAENSTNLNTVMSE